MGSALFEFAVTVAVAWFVWRFIESLLRMHQQPAEPGSSRDDSSMVPARLRPRPKSGAGAVALAEPDEDEEELDYRHSRTGRSDRTAMRAI